MGVISCHSRKNIAAFIRQRFSGGALALVPAAPRGQQHISFFAQEVRSPSHARPLPRKAPTRDELFVSYCANVMLMGFGLLKNKLYLQLFTKNNCVILLQAIDYTVYLFL